MAGKRRPRYERVALQEGARAGVRNPYAFLRQMRQEAHGQDLRSPAGAQGPAQFMPATAQSVGLSPTAVHQLRPSYRAAASLMARYEKQFGSTRDALVAYNAGPGRVGGPLPAETQNYIRTIMPNGEKVVRNLSASSGRAAAAPARTTAPTRSVRLPGSTRTIETEQFDQAGYDQAVRRQKVAELLSRRHGRSSVLFKSGLLSTAPVDQASFQSTSTATQRLPGKLLTIPGVTTTAAGGGASGGGPSSSDVKAAIASARKRLGITEDNGTNRSRDVDKLEKAFGMVGQPWCGIYVGTVMREAGIKVDSRVASVAEIERMARNRTGGFEGGFHSARHARAGDALITRQGQHVALVERVDRDGTIHTIGGNQGTGAVTRGTWKPNQVFGVARPNYKRR